MRGWRLYEQTAFAGCASLFWLARDPGEAVGPVQGTDEDEVAVELFLQAMQHDNLVNARRHSDRSPRLGGRP